MNIVKNKKFLLLIGFLALALLFVYRSKNTVKVQTDKTVKVQKGEVKETLTLSGNIDASEKTELQFQTAGMLSWVGVKEGDQVQRYQTLAYLDSRQLQKNFQLYMNTYMKTRWDFEQTQETNKNWQTDGMTDDQRNAIKRIVEKSQFDLNNSVLNVEIQNLALQHSRISTPITGIVTRIDTPIAGINIIPSQAKIEVVNPTSRYFSVSADQTEVAKLHEGQPVQIILDAFPNETFEGTIGKISFSPQTGQTGTVYEVRVSINNLTIQDLKYRLGMTGDAHFVLNQTGNVLYLPSRAVKSDSQGKYVINASNNKRISVETGLEGDETIEVKGDIIEGELIND